MPQSFLPVISSVDGYYKVYLNPDEIHRFVIVFDNQQQIWKLKAYLKNTKWYWVHQEGWKDQSKADQALRVYLNHHHLI